MSPRDRDGAEPTEPLWFLRTNPLLRRRLSDPSLRGLLTELLAADHELREAADRGSAELYEAIGAAADDETRKRLVAARRSLHANRAPRLDGEPTPAVGQWLVAKARYDELHARLAAEYAGASARERATLAALLGDEDLLRSLALVAPEVYGEAERYRAAVNEGGPLKARTRKGERGLIQYVTRAMVRTSPLARFTAVGLAVPEPDGPAPDAVPYAGARAFPELDRVMLAYVMGGLTAPDDDGLIDAWVSLAPTSALDPAVDALFVLRPGPDGMKRLSVPLSPPVRLLLDAVTMGPRPTRSVVTHVAGRAGCTEAEALALVRGALKMGIFCTFSEAEDGSPDLPEALAPRGPLGADMLRDLTRRLPAMAETPAAGRGAELTGLREDLADLSRTAGRPAQITVEEDFVLPPGTVATAPWQPALRDVGHAVELLTLFDWLHDVRVLMSAAFVERFGPGANVPLAEHADFISGEVARRAAAMSEVYGHDDADGRTLAGLGPKDGSLEQLYALRQHITEAAHAALAKGAAAGDAEVSFSGADIAELTASLPERFRRDPVVYGVLLQQDGERLIVNDGLPGHGMLYARFLRADRALGGRALPYLADRLTRHYGADGTRVVEDLGLHRLNVNAHPRILPDALSPDDWYALRLVHDKDTDALRVEDADGRKLAVLPLGTGHPGLFPAPLSVASGLVISGRLYNGLPNSWAAATAWDGRDTRFCPAMAVGRAVISRRRWYGGEELTRAVDSGPEELDRLTALTAWRGRHGVPAELIIKNSPADEGPTSVSAPDAQARRLQQKPQYVDLASALNVRVLPRMLDRRGPDGAGVTYLEEALPGVTDDSRATEWVVEIGRRPGGRFGYGEDV